MRGTSWSRGAEEFDALVAGDTGRGQQEHHELLELVAALRAVPAPQARPEFVTSLRSQLVAAAEREPARGGDDLAARLTPRQRRGSRERRLAALVGGFAVVSASGSMAMASQGSLPGDVLYPVKRAIENAQTNLQPDGAAKAESLLDHAGARLEEVQKLTAQRADADKVSATLQDFTDQTEQAAEFAISDYAATGDGERITELRTFAASSMDVLTALSAVVPEDSRSILITATQTVHQVDAAAWEACASCADVDLTQLPDLAAQSLGEVLSGDIPDIASVTVPGNRPSPKPEPAQGETTPGVPPAEPDGPDTPAAPGSSPSPAPSSQPTPKPKPPTIGGTVGGALEEIDKGVGGALGGGSPAKPEGEPTTLTGTLIDGVGGLLGGLGLLK